MQESIPPVDPMRARGPLVALMVAATVTAGAAQAPRLEPVDEGLSHPDFAAFRTGLRQAISRRDVPALLRAVHPDIKYTFGDDNGIEAFKRLWRLDRADSRVWNELGPALALGGTFQDPASS